MRHAVREPHKNRSRRTSCSAGTVLTGHSKRRPSLKKGRGKRHSATQQIALRHPGRSLTQTLLVFWRVPPGTPPATPNTTRRAGSLSFLLRAKQCSQLWSAALLRTVPSRCKGDTKVVSMAKLSPVEDGLASTGCRLRCRGSSSPCVWKKDRFGHGLPPPRMTMDLTECQERRGAKTTKSVFFFLRKRRRKRRPTEREASPAESRRRLHQNTAYAHLWSFSRKRGRASPKGFKRGLKKKRWFGLNLPLNPP